MTAGGPTGSHLQKRGVIRVADINTPARNVGTLDLRVTTQAEVRVALDEHFLVDGAVRSVANRATFAQRLMLKNKRARLLAMACRATFVLPGHGQTASRLEYIPAVRVVAGHATHVTFDHRMMLRQVEFGLNVQVTLKTGRRVVAWIDDEFYVAAGFDVFAAGTVAGFASGLAGQRRTFKMNPRMGAGGKFPDDFRVTIQAGLVADVMRAGNFQGHRHFGGRGGAGIQKQGDHDGGAGCGDHDCGWLQPHPAFRRVDHEFQRSAG